MSRGAALHHRPRVRATGASEPLPLHVRGLLRLYDLGLLRLLTVVLPVRGAHLCDLRWLRHRPGGPPRAPVQLTLRVACWSGGCGFIPCVSTLDPAAVFVTSLTCLLASSSRAMHCLVLTCHVIAYFTLTCHVIACFTLTCHVMSCHWLSRSHVMSCHVVSLVVSPVWFSIGESDTAGGYRRAPPVSEQAPCAAIVHAGKSNSRAHGNRREPRRRHRWCAANDVHDDVGE